MRFSTHVASIRRSWCGFLLAWREFCLRDMLHCHANCSWFLLTVLSTCYSMHIWAWSGKLWITIEHDLWSKLLVLYWSSLIQVWLLILISDWVSFFQRLFRLYLTQTLLKDCQTALLKFAYFDSFNNNEHILIVLVCRSLILANVLQWSQCNFYVLSHLRQLLYHLSWRI